jgi:hypothetical protein
MKSINALMLAALTVPLVADAQNAVRKNSEPIIDMHMHARNDWAVDAIESADFLTPEQKRDIFYNNAARFLRLSEAEIARHHGLGSK